jgi:acyl carrier protein
VRPARASARRAPVPATFVDALGDRVVPPRLACRTPGRPSWRPSSRRSSRRIRAKILEPDTALVSSGLVDSLSLIQVLAFIEDEFQVVIPDEAATAESMNTVRKIDELIDAYGGSG